MTVTSTAKLSNESFASTTKDGSMMELLMWRPYL
eukprot:CAMPEP_0198144540 /NCGR_PEP_ID=MMETSP1443-20131203/16427_1 /TAXON_ID=186043 /ORGANISM="Entomoneis sp., Strain CCMP2396" /LENGTH=33 /DNA_ID= /DNA_START= /DNA_END= /DNA_ORIENTATION=